MSENQTTADSRVGEIQASAPLAYRPENRQAATEDLIRWLTATSALPGNVRLPREAMNMLLAQLRARDEVIAAGFGLADNAKAEAWDEAHFGALGCDSSCCDYMHGAPEKDMNPYRTTP